MGKLNSNGAIPGARVFGLARVIHLIVYLAGVPFLRTVVWVISLVGLVIMASTIV